MKTQKYLVTIEMPDGDMIGPGWIRDIIQADCDVEDTGRQKVSVEEYGDVDWDEYRREVAKDAMCSIMSNSQLIDAAFDYKVDVVGSGIFYADELIKWLKEKTNEST